MDWVAAATVINAVGLVFVAYQVRLTRTATQQDHIRRSREVTLEYLDSLGASKPRLALQTAVVSPLTAERVSELRLARSGDDRDLLLNIVRYLNQMERLAVGVHLGVYDLTVVWQLAGLQVLGVWKRYEQYIRRCQLDQDDMYNEFEALVAHVKQLEQEWREKGKPSLPKIIGS